MASIAISIIWLSISILTSVCVFTFKSYIPLWLLLIPFMFKVVKE